MDLEDMISASEAQNESLSQVQIYSSFKKNLNEQTLESLFKLVKTKLISLVSYFLSNDFIPKKRRWMQFMRLIINNQNQFDNLDIEMKKNHLRASTHFEAGKILG
jgi:hypothetical protein